MGSPTKFKLSEAEVKNIQFRRMVMDYISELINNDTGKYIYTDVRPRLGLKPEAKVELSEDGEWLTLVEEAPVILKP